MQEYSDIDYGIELVAADRAKASGGIGYPINEVSPEEITLAHRWADGTALEGIVDTDGYQVIINKLHRYMDEAIFVFLNTDKTNKDAIWANGIAAQMGRDIVERLKSDIAADLAAAKEPPDIVKQSIRLARGSVQKS